MTKAIQVYETIKDFILQNQILPGERIYIEALSKRLKISPTPLREALNRLVQDGHFCYAPNRGYILRAITTSELEKLYEVCEALETYAIRRAVYGVTPAVLVDLWENLEKYQRLNGVNDSREKFIVNSQFHLRIASLCNNEIITEQLTRVFEKIVLKWKVENMVHVRGSEPHEEHLAIYYALEKRNEKSAVECMRIHINNTKNSALRRLRIKEDLFMKGEKDSRLSSSYSH